MPARSLLPTLHRAARACWGGVSDSQLFTLEQKRASWAAVSSLWLTPSLSRQSVPGSGPSAASAGDRDYFHLATYFVTSWGQHEPLIKLDPRPAWSGETEKMHRPSGHSLVPTRTYDCALYTGKVIPKPRGLSSSHCEPILDPPTLHPMHQISHHIIY